MKLQTNPNNPRTISKDKFQKLKRSIERNPDGLTAFKIAHKDGVIISGNQRYRALQELGIPMKPEWFKDLSGWTEDQITEWVIQSNISAGEWDWDALANEWDENLLEEWGLEINEKIDKMEDGDEIEFETSIQIEPPKEYIMIVCEPNSQEWEDLKEKLKLKMVRRGGYKKGSPFDDVGLERLLEWEDFQIRYDQSESEEA